MSGVSLLLGAVEFTDFELPAGINFGGSQRLAIHHLASGTRVIDALGRDDADISFSGIFSGSNATLRARALDEMRVSGQVYPLTWDVFLYSVIIKRFEADYKAGWWIPYRITCSVLRDEASAIVETFASAAQSVAADITTAGTYASGVGIDVTAAQTTLSQPDATVLGSSAYASAAAALAQTNATIGASISQAETTLAGCVVSEAGTPGAAIAGLSGAASTAGQLSSLVTAQAYLGRATTNLVNVST